MLRLRAEGLEVRNADGRSICIPHRVLKELIRTVLEDECGICRVKENGKDYVIRLVRFLLIIQVVDEEEVFYAEIDLTPEEDVELGRALLWALRWPLD